MELWTEYEGRTIDGLFPLTKLLRPEGRSAFFLTSNGNGVPRVIRLIEPHFDEDEILARWRGVVALNHPNILKLEKFGQVELEGGSFLYAVMEPVEANLGDVLVQQRLTLPDTRQLASSLISAIDCLHSHGFVHEHIEPAHVFAVGETVKLRSDCIREAPEAEDGRRLKQQDLHDYGVVLLQALTQQKTLEAAGRDMPLPAPFDRLVPRTISGDWGVADVSAALESEALPRVAAAAPAVAAASTPSPAPSRPLEPAKVEARPTPGPVQLPLHMPDEEEPRSSRLNLKWIAAIVVAIALLIWLGWYFFSDHPANPASNPQPTATASAPAPAPESSPTVASTPAKPSAATTPARVRAVPAASTDTSGDSQHQWRVIAFTYNHQDQAQHKADTVARAHPELQPQVFSPTGRAPFLVALGGPMTRDDAFALAHKVRSEGLPRDTYAQNYTGKGR